MKVITTLSFLVLISLFSLPVDAGLYEELLKDKIYWIPPLQPPKPDPDTFYERLITPDPESTLTKIFDSRFEPIMLVRTSFSYTYEEKYEVKLEDGRTLTLNSANMDASQYGHKFGPALESVEIGMKGRYQSSGFYYLIKQELTPREKDGNRSSDYLKDAYVGWNKFTIGDISAGRMKVPFSQANMKSTEKGNLIYTPLLDVLTPKRQVGYKLSLSDPYKVLKFTYGLYTSISFASELIKKSDQMMYTYRFDISGNNLLKLFNIIYRDLHLNIGLNAATTKMSYSTQTENLYLGADLNFHLYIFSIEAEYLIKNFYQPPLPDGTLKSDKGWGWHIDLIVHIWPNIIDLIARVEEMDGDKEERGKNTSLPIDELVQQKKHWTTLGITTHLSNQVKLQLNYIQRGELEGYRFDNNVLIGLVQFSY